MYWLPYKVEMMVSLSNHKRDKGRRRPSKRKTHFGIPDECTFSSLENDGKRVVAVQWVRDEISKGFKVMIRLFEGGR